MARATPDATIAVCPGRALVLMPVHALVGTVIATTGVYSDRAKEHAMPLSPYWIRLSLLVALLAPLVCLAQAPGEREVPMESPRMPSGTLLDVLGLSRPEFGGLRLSAFVVGSFSYNSHLQMVPEFAGSTPALADPGSTNFRFDTQNPHLRAVTQSFRQLYAFFPS